MGDYASVIKLVAEERRLERERCLKAIAELPDEIAPEKVALYEAALRNGIPLRVLLLAFMGEVKKYMHEQITGIHQGPGVPAQLSDAPERGA